MKIKLWRDEGGKLKVGDKRLVGERIETYPRGGKGVAWVRGLVAEVHGERVGRLVFSF